MRCCGFQCLTQKQTPLPYSTVLPPGLEPGTTVPKTVVISISLQERPRDTTWKLGE